MAQFDVHANQGRAREGFPYLVIVQSGEFEASPNRLVVPLARPSAPYPVFAPVVSFGSETLVVDALLMFSVQRGKLGSAIGSVAQDSDAVLIMAAIDRVISTAFG